MLDRSPTALFRSDDHRQLLKEKPELILHDAAAANAETPPELLDEYITPLNRFFVRLNGRLPPPAEDAARWSVDIDGEIIRPQRILVPELLERFAPATVTTVLECAGNGRIYFDPPTDGVPWGPGAVGCATFSGVRLADVLEAAGLTGKAHYIAFHSPDVDCDNKDIPAISRGLPLWKAMAPETLVATHMNGAPLQHLHGAPVRIVAPGFPGSAWQKWLTRIWVRDREHDGPKMTGTDYRMPLRAYAPGQKIDERDFAVIEELPTKTLITHPGDGAELKVGEPVELRGFAWSGYGAVTGVKVSFDGSRFQPAELEPAADRFAWYRFRATFTPTKPGPSLLIARATDEMGRVQPLGEAAWNPRGYLNDRAHQVIVIVRE